MRRLASSVILCTLSWLCACGPAAEDYETAVEEMPPLVSLDVCVALSDVSDVLTRAAGYADAANDNEKMHTLRIIIVRPDWTVEANRLIDLRAASALKHQVAEPFEVFGNEWKRIYLFVNEGTEAKATDGTGLPRRLVDYRLDQIVVGSNFPVRDINELKIRLEDDTDQIEGPLPMSEMHECFVNKESDQSCNLFVTRAAVKFTFHLINHSSRDITLDGLTIDKMAHVEWYMPRASYGEPNTDGVREITEYEVPASVGYYVYRWNASLTNGVTVKSSGEEVLPPIYLLEGKYTDDADPRNYSMEISVNNIKRKHFFPELGTLPRNTHVVVHITCDADTKVSCQVDVIPYSQVILEPDFGL